MMMVKREASEVNNSVHADFLRKYLVDKEKIVKKVLNNDNFLLSSNKMLCILNKNYNFVKSFNYTEHF